MREREYSTLFMIDSIEDVGVCCAVQVWWLTVQRMWAMLHSTDMMIDNSEDVGVCCTVQVWHSINITSQDQNPRDGHSPRYLPMSTHREAGWC